MTATNDKKHAAQECQHIWHQHPEQALNTICPRCKAHKKAVLAAQELDLDALEQDLLGASYVASQAWLKPRVTALIARVREAEHRREKAQANLQAECDAKVAALARAREAEQLLRESHLSVPRKLYERVAEFLKSKAGGR